jgi:homoserine O-acetyltransferase
MRPRELTIPIGALQLDSGEMLPAVEQRVTVYGEPNVDGSKVVLAAQALTGSSRVAEWWPAIAAENAAFDLGQWCVIGITALSSCCGSTGPTMLRSSTSGVTSSLAIVRAEQRVIDHLGLEQLAFVIGGSLGGMQALQWVVDAPQRVSHAVVIGAHDHHSAVGIAFMQYSVRDLLSILSEVYVLARKIAVLTYKSHELFNERHDRRSDRRGQSRFDIKGYLDHQANRFEGRMDAATYATLIHPMDSFDVRDALIRNSESPQVTFIEISSDWLFRREDVQAASERFRLRGLASRYIEWSSSRGHDAFLAESKALAAHLGPLLPRPNDLTQPANSPVYRHQATSTIAGQPILATS